MKPVNPIGKILLIYAFNLFVFCLFCALGAIPFYIIFDYLYRIQESTSKIEIDVNLVKGLVIMLGACYALIGSWVGWKLRTHSVYNDIMAVTDKTEWDELNTALRDYGERKGWIEK